MLNSPIQNSQAAYQLLNALNEQLAARGESHTLAVVGGSALLALGLISRPKRDVDILAIVENNELYATVDQGAGKHLKDLEALRPTHQELLDAARWSRSHDPSEGYLGVLKRVLAHFGVDSGNLDP